MKHVVAAAAVLSVVLVGSSARAAEKIGRHTLDNKQLRVVFDMQGLCQIRDKTLGRSIDFKGDRFALKIDDATIDSKTLKPQSIRKAGQVLTYRYKTGELLIDAVYELRGDWRFVSKHLRVSTQGKYHIKSATVFGAGLNTPVISDYRNRGGSYGAFLRFGDTAKSTRATFGMFAVIQNPFLKFELKDGDISLAYEPDMEWSRDYGSFESDRVCLGTYRLSGTEYPGGMLPEWHYLPQPLSYEKDKPLVDINGTLAMSDCVRAFMTYRPKKTVRIHVDWCENVYQMDLSRKGIWQEYQRIIKRAAEVGCDHILYSPHDENLAPLKDSRDAWRWESLLWLGMGQKIRKGEWIAGKDPLPKVVQERLAFAKKHNIKLVPYVYPTLPFMQDPEWTAWVGKLKGSPKPGGYRGANTGIRSFQDWFVDQLAAFKKQTGVGGFAFDHWWIAYKKEEVGISKYAQWYGCRRILLKLRERCPDALVDGRQQYHWFGPWTWLGGSYPHPLASDEQPQSFRSFPDLHWSRGSADRQRYMGWWYRMRCFAPVEVMPGYMTHQTMRSDVKGVMRRDRYRVRDMDYLGWKYSVISSIATAPINHVVNYLPARDETEYKSFSDSDKQWLRDWLDWTDTNLPTLRKLRPIIGQPMVGRCDGTAAIKDGRGFVFLFNPNYRQLDAEFTLDESIGLAGAEGKQFVLRQLYPDLGKGSLKAGPLQHGQKVRLAMNGASAIVLGLEPLAEKLAKPLLAGCPGQVALQGGKLELTKVAGEPGAKSNISVILPGKKKITSLSVNGRPVAFTQTGDVVTASVTFAGRRFAKCQQIGVYDANFKARTFKGSFSVPKRVMAQLAARKKAWPIPYNEAELAATWTAPHRLLMFVNIADPKDEMEVSMKIDGKPVQVKKAYSSVYRSNPKNTFLGFYADLSDLKPEKQYKVTVELPELQPGQFQGLFFDNIEPEHTTTIAAPER
ncbi:MAG: hypothetical protein QGG42_02690 [Phycisphaerae bacterium]|jgi:hypothetical protein|nr:hypothetical protein [Phycisphaerae bacterium]